MDKKLGVRPDTGGARAGDDLLGRRHLHLRPEIQRPTILQSHKVSESYATLVLVMFLLMFNLICCSWNMEGAGYVCNIT